MPSRTTSDHPGCGAGSGQPRRPVGDSSTRAARGEGLRSTCQKVQGGARRLQALQRGKASLCRETAPASPGSDSEPRPTVEPGTGFRTSTDPPDGRECQALREARGLHAHALLRKPAWPGPCGDARRGLWGAAQPRSLTLHSRFCQKHKSFGAGRERAELTGQLL